MPLHLPAVSIALVAFPYDCTSFCRKYNNRRLRSSCSRVLGKVSKCYQFTKPAAGVSVSWEAEYSSLSFCLQRNVAGLDTDFWWLRSAVTSFKFSALKILVRRGAGCRQMCLRSELAMKEALACCAILFLLNGSKWDLPRGKRCQWESIRDELVGCKLWIRLVGFFFPTVITFFFLLDFCGNTVLFYCTEVLLQTAVDLAAKILVLCFSLALADLGFVVLGA